MMLPTVPLQLGLEALGGLGLAGAVIALIALLVIVKVIASLLYKAAIIFGFVLLVFMAFAVFGGLPGGASPLDLLLQILFMIGEFVVNFLI